MAVLLQKGQRVDLTKGKTLKRVRIGLGWKTQEFSGAEFDLDASAFLVNGQNRVLPETNFVFYNNLTSADGSVTHTGDNRVGGDEESIEEEILVDFAKIDPSIQKIAIAVTIFDAETRNQFFGQVTNAFVVLFDDETNEEILRFNLEEDYSTLTAVTFCELYRSGVDWKFNAVGAGFTGGLADLCKHYGLEVA